MARVLGYVAGPIMLAPILGPVIAGAILQHASWRATRLLPHIQRRLRGRLAASGTPL